MKKVRNAALPTCEIEWCVCAAAAGRKLCAIHLGYPKYKPPPTTRAAVIAAWDRVKRIDEAREREERAETDEQA